MDKQTRIKLAKIRRNWFLACCIAVLLALLAALVWFVLFIGSVLGGGAKSGDASDITSSISQTASEKEDASSNKGSTASKEEKRPQFVQRGNYQLDAEFTDLLLVNGNNPLPDDYDYEGALITIDNKYRQPGYDLNQINEKVYPYMQAMCEAAWEDGVALKVCSPYRSYAIQQTLFNRQVTKWKNTGLSQTDAEARAATIVARPGTSQHHTGLAIDFIKADDSFEQHPAFAWLQQHAADYGFIMRYPKEKESVTGVIYESWHYRFVGIYEAQAIKESGLCLEEYLEKKK